MTQHSMLVVEDDPKLQQMLQAYFESQGFRVEVASDGAQGAQMMLATQPDIVLLDLMLPVMDGITVCRQTRSGFKGKILMLTASDDEFDHVAGLETGADDFVTKPIKPRILLARVRTLLRRNSDLGDSLESAELKTFGQLRLNNRYKKCELRGEVINLTDSEFDLLWLLATNADIALSREFLTQALRGIEYDGFDRTVDNKVVRLRKRLGDDDSSTEKIQTVRGKGYQFISKAWG